MNRSNKKLNGAPPRLAKGVLRWFCATQWLEEIEGDLEEQFHRRAQQKPWFWASVLYWKDMLLFMRPYVLRRPVPYTQARGPIMILHYLKVAARNIWKQKLYAFINIVGLAVGLAVCMLLFLFVRHEWRHDRFHEHQDRIYRLTRATDLERTAVVSAPLAPTFQADFAEVEHFVRFANSVEVVHRGEQAAQEQVTFADPALLEVFTFPLRQGDPAQALQAPMSVVMTAAMAEKYFPGEDPLGQTLSIKLGGVFQAFTVTGVLGEIPTHSSIEFSLILPYLHIREGRGEAVFTDWMHSFTSAFVLLREDADVAALRAKVPLFVEAHFQERLAAMRERGAQGSDADLVQIGLQPLTAIHFDAGIDGSVESVANPVLLYILAGLALFILVIACLNFVNLAVARAATRTREIGVRKVVGAVRGQLMRQFWGEALLLSSCALVLGVLLAALCLPTFNTLAEKSLTLDLHTTWTTGVFLIGLTVLVGLLAGGYPAAYLSRFRPVEVLKGTIQRRGKRRLSKALVVFQFALSIMLIVGTMLLSRQVDFLRGKDLGFDAEQVVALPTQTDDGAAFMERFRQALATRREVVQVTGGSTPMSDWWSRAGVEIEDQRFQTFHIRADYRFLETFDMDLVAGRDFSEDFATDGTDAVLVNEAFTRRMGWTEPLGKTFDFLGVPVTVVGVVKDFHFISLHYPVGPLVIHLHPERTVRYLFVRVRPTDLPATLALLEATWRALAPDLPFIYRFLDERIAQQYEMEERITRIVGYSAVLAIVIACLGLFGLSALMVTYRTKEIGIRKVLGASVPGLVRSLNTEYMVLVVLANLIAWPLAYLGVEQLLQFHAYRVDIAWGIFFIAGLAAFGIALLTVSYQSIKAALADPVESLRYE